MHSTLLEKNPSCLRQTSKEVMLYLTMEKVATEIKDRAPLLHSVLTAACINGRSKAKKPTCDFAAVGMAAAVCLRNRSMYMIAVQLMMTTFLYHSNWLVSNLYYLSQILKIKLSFMEVAQSSVILCILALDCSTRSIQ